MHCAKMFSRKYLICTCKCLFCEIYYPRKFLRLQYIPYVEKFCESLPKRGGRNIHEGGSDILRNTITWLLCKAQWIFDSGWILLSIIRHHMSLADSWQYSFNKRLTGAVRCFQEGTGPASFNSNCLDISPGYAHARLLFLYAATFIASTP